MMTPDSEQNSDSEPRVDWGDALVVPNFYGRAEEQTVLSRWIVQEGARVVCVLGMGGIGKSALSVTIMHQLAHHFQIVLFRSLRDAPSCDALLDDCLQALAPETLSIPPTSQGRQGPVPTEQRFALLLECLRQTRTLLVLDNLECLLQEGDVKGHFRADFKDYELLLHRVIEKNHQSCLLFTSREQPAELRLLEGRYSFVHSLRLTGLEAVACQQFFVEKEIIGSQQEQQSLIEVYTGNPLALKIVTETIVDQFAGQLGQFLAQGQIIFGSINALLAEQFARLAPLEQTVLCWLAIMREPGTLNELSALPVTPLPRHRQVLFDAIDALRRRSLIESGKRPGSFTLQSVVLEYITLVLITEGSQEIRQCQLQRLIEHSLTQAHAKEYIRQTQERLLVTPLLVALQNGYPDQVVIEQQIHSLLNDLRGRDDDVQGYGPANLIVLLRLLRGNLTGLDLSRLSIRSAYLQAVDMQGASLAGSLMRDCVWTLASAPGLVTTSSHGQWWATGSGNGQVCLWEEGSQQLHLIWQAHIDAVWTLAFSPDGQTLASGSLDGTLKLWNVVDGALLWIGKQYHPRCLAFNTDGSLLACGGAQVRLCDTRNGTTLQTLRHTSQVHAVAFSPDGHWLVTGSFDGMLRLWERDTQGLGTWVEICSVQTGPVWCLAFAPAGGTLVSVHVDQAVRLWEVPGLHLQRTLADLQAKWVVWTPDGQLLAGCTDKRVWLWDMLQDRCRAVLSGHLADVRHLAFTSDGSQLLSNSVDGTLRIWEVQSLQCVRVMASYWISLSGLDWSPDGTHLVEGGSDRLVTIWDVRKGTAAHVLQGHSWHVFATRWSPDGRLVASCGWDRTIRLWDVTTGICVWKFEDPLALYLHMEWSPDGSLLACGTHLGGVQVWDINAGCLHWVGQPSQMMISAVAWSLDGKLLAGAGEDGSVYLWKGVDGTLIRQLSGHHGWVSSVAWSPDGRWLASCNQRGGEGGGELFIWNVETAECVQTFVGHPGAVYAIAWSPHGEQLVSGGSDGKLRWWDVESGACVRMLEACSGAINTLRVSPDGRYLASCGYDGAVHVWHLHSGEHIRTLRHDRPYERLNITGMRGLTEAEIASLQALGAIEDTAL